MGYPGAEAVDVGAVQDLSDVAAVPDAVGIVA